MKIPLSLGFVAAVSGALLACSSDSGTPRNSAAGTAGTGTQTGNAGTGGTGSGGTGSGGTASGGTGSGGTSGGSTLNLGAALNITADGVVSDTQGNTGINGGTPIVVASMANMTPSTAPALSFKAGAICVKGATVALPATPVQADYTANWGFSLQLDLNRGANPNAPTVDAGADAGADAGQVLGQIAEPWDPKAHNVIGFSFKLTGNDPAITNGQGVPPQMRLQTLPTGGDPAMDTYCATLTTASGTEESVTFDKMFYQCYNSPPGRAVFADPLPAAFNGSLQNLQWQVNSASSLAFQVDFCLSDIQPILGN
jgi:hypothetical protein